MILLTIHLAIAYLIVMMSLMAIFWAPARRFVLYVLVLQILVGFAVMSAGKPIPPAHWILAILNGGTYAMGSAFARRGRPQPLVIATYVIGLVIFVITFGIGMQAVKG